MLMQGNNQNVMKTLENEFQIIIFINFKWDSAEIIIYILLLNEIKKIYICTYLLSVSYGNNII